MSETLRSRVAQLNGDAGAVFLGKLQECVLLGLTFLMPLWFLPKSLDILELNKQTLLLVGVTISTGIWIVRALLRKRVQFAWSWMHIAVMVFVGTYAVVSIAASDSYLAWFGNIGQIPTAFATIFALAVFYALLASGGSSIERLYRYIFAFLASSIGVVIIGLLQMSGHPIFQVFSQKIAIEVFNTVGTANSFATFAAIPMVTALAIILFACTDERCILSRSGHGSRAALGLSWVALLGNFAVLLAVNFSQAWYVAFAGIAILVVFATVHHRAWVKDFSKISIPIVIIAFGLLAIVWKSPIQATLPNEVAPSMSHSWSIAKKVLQDHPLVGMGPGAWMYAYAQYRDPIVNVSPFWTIRFERGMSFALTLLATVGLIGFCAWILLLISGFIRGLTVVATNRLPEQRTVVLVLFSAWFTLVVSTFLQPVNMAHLFVFWMFFALLALAVSKEVLVWDGSRSTKAASVLLSVLLSLIGIGAVCVLWMSMQRLAADRAYSEAVSRFQQGKSVEESIERLLDASAWNRWNDVYPRNLSQAYLIQLSQKMSQVSATPTVDEQRILMETQMRSIDQAKRAIELNPANVDNWSNMAVIAEAVASFTPGADEQALKHFEEALKREPVNAVFWNEMGKIHIMRADAFATRLSIGNTAARTEARKQVETEWTAAERSLVQSIKLKSDYAPAHYNLGILFERMGRVKEAVLKLEQVLSKNPSDTGVLFQLGILYYRDGQKDKALQVFEELIKKDPNSVNARWYLAAMYEERGKLDSAIAQLSRVVQLLPGNASVQTAYDRLVAERAKNGGSKPEKRGTLPEPIPQSVSGSEDWNRIKP